MGMSRPAGYSGGTTVLMLATRRYTTRLQVVNIGVEDLVKTVSHVDLMILWT